jgi:ABC-type transporter Mla MlaB component
MGALTEWRPSGAMTIEHAAALWAEARSHLANIGCGGGASAGAGAGAGAGMHVDLSAVERLDTAGCQVLLACREDTSRRGAAWRLTGCGPQAIEVMGLLGCAALLDADTEGDGVTEEKAR